MRRVLFIQFGNYADAHDRLAAGGEETYFAQRASVDAVGALALGGVEVTVLCVNQAAPPRIAANGVRSLGVPIYGPEPAGISTLIAQAEQQAPTHLVLCVPLTPVLRWAATRRLRVLPILADSFLGRGPRQWHRRRTLVAALNAPGVEWVGNHNINASRHLAALGVSAAKIVPWDWPPVVTPDDYEPKAAPAAGVPFRLIYVGAVSEPKGTGDVIRALAALAKRGRETTLSVVGGGDVERFRALARTLKVDRAVEFLGPVPHARVLDLMHAHDAVVVPSRHDYSEALPMTIYESFCARTPLIASDHPMFAGKVVDGQSGLTFPASNPEALADRVATLAGDPALYARFSEGALAAWERLQCPVKHQDLYTRWLSDAGEDRRWLSAHSLATGRYDDPNGWLQETSALDACCAAGQATIRGER